ncbi:unnamed protein product [[Candida] boidinii]|uniref:Unnamed protein product n=1 Tax=Candida boidinii TaxID=5477 RepID=A0A9W6SZD0_CANBO|nr:hypothetical protein B5S30_g1227 [[Candida] boidinii]OWB83563.1 hypothetical protein B5S33_g2194 [[Candida] boidinii]GME70741.1 unnamed protein product [[Candida] boidinii]GMG06205.1 unnamed protein product [[Candida] boidinii]
MIIDECSYKYIDRDFTHINTQNNFINSNFSNKLGNQSEYKINCTNFNQILEKNKRKLYSSNSSDESDSEDQNEDSQYYNELKGYNIISNTKVHKRKQVVNFQKNAVDKKLNFFKDGYGNIINYYKLNSNEKSLPKLIINQLNYNKININDIFNDSNADTKPTILIFFGPGDEYFINKINSVQNKLINEMKEVKFIGISASSQQQQLPFRVIQDSGSKIIKSLNLLDPLGGGIFPISSILIFDSNGLETVKLNYKYNHDFLNHSSNDFENLVYEVLDYLS